MRLHLIFLTVKTAALYRTYDALYKFPGNSIDFWIPTQFPEIKSVFPNRNIISLADIVSLTDIISLMAIMAIIAIMDIMDIII